MTREVRDSQGRQRVLMVLEHMGDGGTETYVRELASFLSDRKDIRILCLAGDAKAASVSAGRPVEVVRKGLAGWLDLARALRATRGGVVHLHLYTSLWRAVLFCRLVGRLRVISTFHMPLRQWSLRHRLAWRTAARLSDFCVGVSRDCIDSLGRAVRGNGVVIPAALAFAAMPRKTNHRQSQSGAFAIAGGGRLAREKSWAILIEAVAAVRRAGMENVTLELFGDGPLRAELEAHAATLGIADFVAFHGFTQRDRMLEMLARMDLFVLPSKFEGLGISAVEAMAVGLPTITSDFPASRDFIEDGVTGERFPRGDAAALTRLIIRHVEAPARSSQMAAKGQAFVIENFSPERTFGRYAALYDPDPPND